MYLVIKHKYIDIVYLIIIDKINKYSIIIKSNIFSKHNLAKTNKFNKEKFEMTRFFLIRC